MVALNESNTASGAEYVRDIKLDNIQDVDSFPENVSQTFINSIVAAELCRKDSESRYYLEIASKSLNDPIELYITKLLLRLPKDNLKKALKQISQKYGR